MYFGNSVSRSYREQFLFFSLSSSFFFSLALPLFLFLFVFFRFSRLQVLWSYRKYDINVFHVEFVPLISFMIILNLIIAHLIGGNDREICNFWYEKNCSFFFRIDISYCIFFMLETRLCSYKTWNIITIIKIKMFILHSWIM